MNFNKNENLFTLPMTITERLQRDGTITTRRTLTNGDANGDGRKRFRTDTDNKRRRGDGDGEDTKTMNNKDNND